MRADYTEGAWGFAPPGYSLVSFSPAAKKYTATIPCAGHARHFVPSPGKSVITVPSRIPCARKEPNPSVLLRRLRFLSRHQTRARTKTQRVHPLPCRPPAPLCGQSPPHSRPSSDVPASHLNPKPAREPNPTQAPLPCRLPPLSLPSPKHGYFAKKIFLYSTSAKVDKYGIINSIINKCRCECGQTAAKSRRQIRAHLAKGIDV
jgi:hypothetical protein